MTTALSPVKHLKSIMQSMPNVELETRHFFANGMYARVVVRPADTTVAGAVHKHEHFYIVTKGRVLVTDGMSPAKEYLAGDVIVSQPGTERIVHAVEDSICMTVHRCDKTDLAEIEEELVEPDENSPFTIGNKLKALPCPS
jgi:quercetin dioxygenase-like cupin family protein